MKTTIVLVTGPGPGGMRQLANLELPAVPLPGEHVHLNGRTYRALERSWRLENIEVGFSCAVGLLVEQIAGPPHVLTALSGVPS